MLRAVTRWSAVATLAFSALAANPRFEVASVRLCRADAASPHRGDSKNGGRGASPVSLRLNCQTVMSLIQWAYVNFAGDRFDPLASIPITGGPAWIDSDLFEINAKADAPRSWGTLNGLMLRTLLEDRFKLKIRRETRGAPVYALTIAKGGPGWSRRSPEAASHLTTRIHRRRSSRGNPFPACAASPGSPAAGGTHPA